MCNLKCSVATVIVGIILVVGSCLISFLVVPIVVQNIIVSETALIEDTIQMERFQDPPFPLNFSVTVFSISNPAQVLTGGAPIMEEAGPYVYKMYFTRNISALRGDLVTYRLIERFEFDAEASFPHTENDVVTVVNAPYHAIIQIAETQFSSLMPVLSLAMSNVFGDINSPIMTVNVRDLLFDGISICQNPGLLGNVVCGIIRSIGETAKNLVQQPDGSMLFSLLAYKTNDPSEEYEVYRGIADHTILGDVRQYAGRDNFIFWDDENPSSICNMINGTDSAIYAPFASRERSLYAINTDICRSVELRYQHDSSIDGIPTLHFSANEWFLDNSQRCFCLNVSQGINREDGCLFEGAMELYTCVGASLILTYPHFLYADSRYRNSVIGMHPVEEDHRIFVDIEPNTGTPIAGAKRAQFNIFHRPVEGIAATQDLRTALVPVVWVEEAFLLPDEFKDELRSRLLAPLNLLDYLLPATIALCCLLLLIGVLFTVRAKIYTTPIVGKHDDKK